MESSNLTTWHQPVCVIERRKDKERGKGDRGEKEGCLGVNRGVCLLRREIF